jgi:predicted ATPase
MPVNVFVGREAKLRELQEILRKVTAGQGQVVFVAGEAGSGKSALVEEFVRLAELADPDVVAAIGECNAQTGIGDPYLPFRQVLTALTTADEGQHTASTVDTTNASRLKEFVRISSETLLFVGPDLIGLFVPGASLLAKVVMTAAAKGKLADKLAAHIGQGGAASAAVDQEKIFEQYASVLRTLAKQRTLILILDDLHWADNASLSLLFHLARELKDSRVLLAGTFRPDDVALGRNDERHPLEPVLHELKRYYGDIEIDLGEAQAGEGRAFVDELVDREPNQLDAAFRTELFIRTEGHPLFTVEMLRNLQERGDLVANGEGRWVQSKSLDWDELPARVEGVIEERVGRLEEDLRETLNVGSVVGYDFTGELVARVQRVDEREMVRQLSGELNKKHQLVTSLGSQRLDPGGQRLSHYRFRHILFQRYLYNSLDEAERGYLHEAVGNELERLFGAQTGEVAVELARHFEEAGLQARAVGYYQQAGDRAVRLSANQEALAHFYKGLALLETLPKTAERNQRELALQIALFAPLIGAKGYATPELGKAYNRAQELCEEGCEADQLFLVLYGLWGHNLVRGDMFIARDLASQCLPLAEKSGQPALIMEAHRMMDETSFYRGEFVTSRAHLEQTLALYDPKQHRAHAYVYGQDPGVAALSHGSWILWYLGYPDQSLRMSQQALTLGRDSSHPFSLAFALGYAAMLHQLRGEVEVAEELTEAGIALSTDQGLVLWLAWATILRGWMQTERGQTEEGIAVMTQGLADLQALSVNLNRPYMIALLAEAYGKAGRAAEGLAMLAEAYSVIDSGGMHNYEAELHRLRGELLLSQGESTAEVEKHFRRAIDVARAQDAKSLELRAAMSLFRLPQGPDEKAESRQILDRVCRWFTEGSDTADLREARLLLQEPASMSEAVSTPRRSV